MSEKQNNKILEVKDLAISFKTDRGIVKAVRGVSFDLYKGETLCIVGESGSGKSVTNKAIMGISANNAVIDEGSIIFEGEDLIRVSEEEFHRIRGHKIGMIFQDPLSSLNPVMKIGKQITEATLINKNILKRRYNDLISKDLIALRNNKANYEFENNKNLEEIKNIKELNKKIKEDGKIKDNHKNDDKSNKIAEDRLKLNETLKEKLLGIKNSYINKIKELEEVKKFISSNKNEANSDIDLMMKETRINCIHEQLEVLKRFSPSKESSDSDILNNRILYLKEIDKIIKKEYKILNNPLKKKLSTRKKVAKKDNDAYFKKIKKDHEEIVGNLKKEKDENLKKIKSLYKTLSKEDKKKISVYFYLGFKSKGKKEKESEINLTKMEFKKELELKTDIPELDVLFSERKRIKKEIEEENSKFLDMTKVSKAEAKRKALEVMKEVGIPLPEKRYKQYPFEFSGGMRQRIVIAIALTANPEVLICDEPTTALDVTIQAQILDLINNLKKERQLSCIFITHDLGVVAHMADRVAVMYAGKIVEYGKVDEVFFDPRHPYTWALLSSIPDINSKEKLESIPGTPPDMLFPPKGDAFALRSKYALAIDFKYQPPFFKVTDTHYAATWLLYPDAPKVEMPLIVKNRIKNALQEGEKSNAK